MSRQYTANILVQKFALPGSLAIYVFLGDFDDTPAAWSTAPNLVGTHAVFTGMSGAVQAAVKSAKKGKGKGRVKAVEGKPSIPVTGTVPLTSTLLEKVSSGELEDMSPGSVEEYLKENLKWRVALVSSPPPCSSPGYPDLIIRR